jgi:hypothetical protein
MGLYLLLSTLIQAVVPVGLVLIALVVLVRTDIGRDLLDRLIGARRSERDWDNLLHDVDTLREQLQEAQERLDFAERTIVERPSPPALPPFDPTPESITPN